MFVFSKYRRVKDEFSPSGDDYCFVPDFPENPGFLELCCVGLTNFGLFEIELPENIENTDFMPEKVSEDLDSLLYSAKKYPPALAIFKLLIRKEKIDDRKNFEKNAIRILSRQLDNQSKNSYFLAKAIMSDDIERRVGEYYWIAGYNTERGKLNIKWISWDYYIYEAPIDHFEVTLDELKEKFGRTENI